MGDDSKKSPSDPIQNAMGEFGRWHAFVCFIIFLLKFPVAWHQLSIIFVAPNVTFTCSDPALEPCDKTCPEHLFDNSTFTNTIQMEWDLVCDRKSFAHLAQTIFMLGILVGNMVFGAVADKMGRRNPLVIAVIMQLVCGVATSFVTNFWLFNVLRFFTAVATGGTMLTSFVIVMEIVGVKWRELISVLYQIPFTFGHITLPVFAYFNRDWHRLQFALSIPSLLLISYYWLVPESPRWLFTVGRVDESVKVLEKAAKCNKLPTDNIRGNLELIHGAKSDQKAKGNFLDLFRSRNMLVKTICMDFNWFVCGICFFGVTQYVGQAGGNIFQNVAMSALSGIPGTIACIFLLKYWGRKKTLILSNSVCGFAMLAIAFIDPQDTQKIVILATIAITGMSVSFPTVYLYGGELFPTVIRNVAVGTASMMARVGSMIAPFVAAGLNDAAHWLPPVIFGVIPIIGAILVLFLPETRGCALPETIEDGENFGKKVKQEQA